MSHKRFNSINLKSILWKIAAFALIMAVVLGMLIYRGRNRETALAYIDPVNYQSKPFRILEIVPYKGQGQWQYMIPGQEPIQAENINSAFAKAADRWNYWNKTFNQDFESTGLKQVSGAMRYSNSNYFIRDVLGRGSSEMADWWSGEGRVVVQSVSAYEVTEQEIAEADLLIIQSDQTANQPANKGNNGVSMLALYDKFIDRGSVKFYDKDGNVQDASKWENYISYDSSLQIGDGPKQSMDIPWNRVVNILDRAFIQNKATIVNDGGLDKGKLDGNMDKLIFMLCYLSRQTYSLIDDGVEYGFRKLIQTPENDTPVLRTEDSWDGYSMEGFLKEQDYFEYLSDIEAVFHDVLYGDRPEFIETFKDKAQQIKGGDTEDFYKNWFPANSSLIDQVVAYAKSQYESGAITYESYNRMNLWVEKEKHHFLGWSGSMGEIGFGTLGSGTNNGYYCEISTDNTIRYNVWGTFYFMPEYLNTANNNYLNDVYLILGGTPCDPVVDPSITNDPGDVRVLEIEPTNNYYLKDQPYNQNQLKITLGMANSSSKLQITCVTPNALNGMTADLCADYDIILVGNKTDSFHDNSPYQKSLGEGEPYHHVGYYDDALIASTLMNGLYPDTDFTQLNDSYYFKDHPSDDPMRIKAGSKTDSPVLKNIKLEYQKQGTYSYVRYSGNDITDYMQKQLAEYVNMGKPVILMNDMYARLENAVTDFNRYDLGDVQNWNDAKRRQSDENYETYADANLYYALAGIADEAAFAAGQTTISPIYPGKTNLYAGAVLGKSNAVSLSKTIFTIEVDDKGTLSGGELGETESGKRQSHSVIGVDDWNNETKELKELTPLDQLEFDYTIELPQGDTIDSYYVYAVVDRNGDGIFDLNGELITSASDAGNPAAATETESGTESETTGNDGDNDGTQTTATIMDDAVYPVTDFSYSSENHVAGTFTAPAALDALEEAYQFCLIVKNKNTSQRGTWIGYVRPNTVKDHKIRILQITPDGSKASETNSLWLKYFTQAHEDGGEFTLADVDPIVIRTQEEFSSYDFLDLTESATQEERVNQIVQKLHEKFQLIIVGTDYTSLADGEETDLLDDEAGMVLKKYVEKQYPIIFTSDSISYINAADAVTMYETMIYGEWNGKEYSTNGIAGSWDRLYGSYNQWNYRMTKYLRDAIGMDRFGITTTEQRDTESTRRWEKTAEGKKKELQGFTDGMIQEFAYSGEKSLYKNTWVMNGDIYNAPRTSRIRKLNQGTISSYPYRIKGDESGLVQVKSSHAPYYQLYLNRELDGTNDDVTVWYTLESDNQYKATFFRDASGDAVNNYYLYSKGKTYYTGFSMYGDRPDTTELKLFINTIYAALNSETSDPAVTDSGYYQTIVNENTLIQQYGQLSADSATPNRYICYYTDEDELKNLSATIQFKITHETTETIQALVYRKSTGPSSEPKKTYPSVTTGEWQELSLSTDGPYTDQMDGETIVIRPVLTSPDQLYTQAEITFIKQELFDLD